MKKLNFFGLWNKTKDWQHQLRCFELATLLRKAQRSRSYRKSNMKKVRTEPGPDFLPFNDEVAFIKAFNGYRSGLTGARPYNMHIFPLPLFVILSIYCIFAFYFTLKTWQVANYPIK